MRLQYILSILCGMTLTGNVLAAELSARDHIHAALEHWRDSSSHSIVQMSIQRPDWKRSMRLEMWTQGMDKALVEVVAPKKDKGNASLLKQQRMWSFTPKTNRVIKIPGSMMGKSWMGSDFSNNDVTRSDDLLKYYDHNIIDKYEHEGQAVFVIEALPHEDAPVVWGKELLDIRADHILLSHVFYDQDNQIVKRLKTLEIKAMGGKQIASWQRMEQEEEPGKWTEVQVLEAEFALEMPAYLFTLSNLRNPR